MGILLRAISNPPGASIYTESLYHPCHQPTSRRSLVEVEEVATGVGRAIETYHQKLAFGAIF
jgi:hypothetical protein